MKYLFAYPHKIGMISSAGSTVIYAIRELLTNDEYIKILTGLGIVGGLILTFLSIALTIIKMRKEIKQS